MPEEAMLNFKWESFSSQLTNSLDACYEKQYFVDLSLVCKNGTILKCHKMVLSNASSFFRRLLMKNEHPHPMIILHDIEADDLKTIVNFMYCGEIQVVKSEVRRILKIAETLEVSGLKDIRSTILIPETNNSNHKNPGTSSDTECPLKITDARSLTKNNMDVDTSNSIDSNFRKKAPIGKRVVSNPKCRYDLRRRNVNIPPGNNVRTCRPSTSRAASEKSNVADTNEKPARKKTNAEGRISWKEVLDVISKEDQMPLNRLCLMNEVEITASSSRTESFSQGDLPPDDAKTSNYFSSSEPHNDCRIYIKQELDIPSDSECESNTADIEKYDCGENSMLTVDSPVEIFESLHCISEAISVSPKNVFELLKRRGSNG